MAKWEEEMVVGIRLPRDLLKRADKLIPRLRQTDLFAVGRLSRNMVIRLAVARGIEQLEKEHDGEK